MGDPATNPHTVEVVRGRLTDERAEELVGVWTGRGMLDEAGARGRLRDVVCLMLGGAGEIVGASSVYPAALDLIAGRRFWVYRGFAPTGAEEANLEMTRATFEALESEFDPSGDGPIGLCLLIADPEQMRARPEAVWSDPAAVYAGYLENGRQVRIAYFDGAEIGPGVPGRKRDVDLGSDYRIEMFAGQEAVRADDLVELWEREGMLTPEIRRRRVAEVLLVGTHRSGEVVGVSSAYLERNEQLGMDLWYYRAFVAREHRMSGMALSLAVIGRDHLTEGFTSGRDRRAAGMIFEVENDGLKRYFNAALWMPTGFTFIGENERGDHMRVRYFPGAEVPPPPA